MNVYYAIGLMSGTSLDGIDVALCQFELSKGTWHYKLLKSATFSYNKEWKNKLSSSHLLDAISLLKLHKEYGTYLGHHVNKFIKGLPVKINLIASHGHTIFHQPEEKLTFQLGDGHCIAAETKITTVSDFRTFDVALGGHGAPLVPAGDHYLFPSYDFCLNLGGFANVSFDEYGKRIAYDICPVNIAINLLSNEAGKEFDKDGFLAMKGKIEPDLLYKLNQLEFYRLPHPKSLGREWFEKQIIPLITDTNIKLEDRLRTFYEHVAVQLSKTLKRDRQKSVLTTGGGALNKYLIQIIKEHSSNQYVIPGNEIIEFKEALVFAFLGVLRFRNEINVFCSATGARLDSCSGVIHKIR